MNYEDTVFLLKTIVYAKTLASIPYMLYNYRINSNSITYSKDFFKRGDLIYEFAFMVGQEVEDFYNELKIIDDELAINLYNHLCQRYNNFVFDLVRTDNEQKRVFYQLVRQNREFIKSKEQYLSWTAQLLTNSVLGYPLACLCYWGYKTYRMIWI